MGFLMLIKNRFLRFILDDWIAKILCLVLAIVLYVFYQFSSLRERPLSVPLTLIASENLVPATQYPRTVRLVLRGESDEIFAIHENDLEAVLDLGTHTVPGTWRVPVKILKRGTALAAEPLNISIEPSEVSINLETKAYRLLEIIPEFRGQVAQGFEMVRWEVEPRTINAYGPVSVLDGVIQAVTEAIDLTGRDTDFSQRIRVLKADSVINFTTSEFVEVKITIRREQVSKVLPDISVMDLNLGTGLRINEALDSVSVKIRGERRLLENLQATSIVPSVDLTGVAAPGEYFVPVHVVVPDGITVENVDPAELMVTIGVSGARQ